MNRGSEQARLLLRKAASDEAALDAVLDVPAVTDDVFGFHCQQAAEKLVKALLSQLQVPFRHTHDLRNLMDLLTDAGVPLPASLDGLKTLTIYAVQFRYEDVPSEVQLDRRQTRQLIRDLRAFVESKMTLSSP